MNLNTTLKRLKKVTYFVATVLLFSLQPALLSHAISNDDDENRHPFLDQADAFVEVDDDDDDDFRPRLPFIPRRDNKGRDKSDKESLSSRFGGKKNTPKDEKIDRFGKPKDKIIFKLVDDLEIKKTLKANEVEGKTLSKAPLLPFGKSSDDSDTKKQ